MRKAVILYLFVLSTFVLQAQDREDVFVIKKAFKRYTLVPAIDSLYAGVKTTFIFKSTHVRKDLTAELSNGTAVIRPSGENEWEVEVYPMYRVSNKTSMLKLYAGNKETLLLGKTYTLVFDKARIWGWADLSIDSMPLDLMPDLYLQERKVKPNDTVTVEELSKSRYFFLRDSLNSYSGMSFIYTLTVTNKDTVQTFNGNYQLSKEILDAFRRVRPGSKVDVTNLTFIASRGRSKTKATPLRRDYSFYVRAWQ